MVLVVLVVVWWDCHARVHANNMVQFVCIYFTQRASTPVQRAPRNANVTSDENNQGW